MHLVWLNTRMKIVQLSTSLSGGAGIAAKRLNRALCSIGLNSQIFAISNKKIDLVDHEFIINRNKLKRLESSLVTGIQAKLIQSGHSLVSPFSISSIKANYQALQDADIIHIHATFNLISEKVLKDIFGMKKNIFMTMHDSRVFTGGCHTPLDCKNFKSNCSKCPQVMAPFRGFVENAFNKRLDTFSTNKVINLISPSSWLATEALESKVLKNRKIHIVRNPIPDIFAVQNRKNSREKFKILVNEVVVVFVAGDLSNPNKGISTLIEASRIVLGSANRNYRFIFVGKNLDESELAGLKYETLETNSDLQLAELLAAADILIVPSLSDNSPNVIGEALMSGLMVAGSKIGGITEVLREMNFPLFQVNDSHDLAEIIIKFDVDYNREIIKAKAKSVFSYSIIASKMEEIYSLQN